MVEMVRHHLRKHKYKIAVGVPMVFLLASSLSLVRDPEEMCIVPSDNRYVEVGEQVTLEVIADADTPINVLSATIVTPPSMTIQNISREESIIDLWSDEPVATADGKVHFSGGIIRDTGFLGRGLVLTLTVVPTEAGEAKIFFEDTTMLAHDGTGTEVTCSENPIVLSVRPESFPNPDVNGDKHVNLFDFGVVSARLFMAYNRSYDLNLDGKITIADIGVLISNISSGSRLGSLALLWSQ